jgi:hypothetical protein
MSMLELPTIVGEMPMMGVFNNLIMFDQHVPQVLSNCATGSNGTTASRSPPPPSNAPGI